MNTGWITCDNCKEYDDGIVLCNLHGRYTTPNKAEEQAEAIATTHTTAVDAIAAYLMANGVEGSTADQFATEIMDTDVYEIIGMVGGTT